MSQMSHSEKVLLQSTGNRATMPFEAFEAQADWLLEQFDKCQIRRCIVNETNPEFIFERILVTPLRTVMYTQLMMSLKNDRNSDEDSEYITNWAGNGDSMQRRYRPDGSEIQGEESFWPTELMAELERSIATVTRETIDLSPVVFPLNMHLSPARYNAATDVIDSSATFETVVFTPSLTTSNRYVVYQGNVDGTNLEFSFLTESLHHEGMPLVVRTIGDHLRTLERRRENRRR